MLRVVAVSADTDCEKVAKRESLLALLTHVGLEEGLITEALTSLTIKQFVQRHGKHAKVMRVLHGGTVRPLKKVELDVTSRFGQPLLHRRTNFTSPIRDDSDEEKAVYATLRVPSAVNRVVSDVRNGRVAASHAVLWSQLTPSSLWTKVKLPQKYVAPSEPTGEDLDDTKEHDAESVGEYDAADLASEDSDNSDPAPKRRKRVSSDSES